VPHTLVLLETKVITTLQKLGLTFYEAKVYATLVATEGTTATVLSTESKVPRTKIYDVLKRILPAPHIHIIYILRIFQPSNSALLSEIVCGLRHERANSTISYGRT